MSRLKKDDIQKIKTLENAVINDTPEDVAAILRELGEVAFTAHILGIACRFRGAGMAEVLIENGATFRYDADIIKYSFFELFGIYYQGKAVDFTYLLFKNSLLSYDVILRNYVPCLKDKNGRPPEVVSDEELIRTVMLLCKNAEKTGFDPGDFLYYMIFCDETEMISALKNIGITLSDKKKLLLTEGKKDRSDDWYLYCLLTDKLDNENFIRVMSEFIAGIGDGKKLHFTEYFGEANGGRFFDPRSFGFLLENFDSSKMNKTKLLKKFIDDENTECLNIALQNGWLDIPGKRDAMIQYAADTGKTESTAYLLDFKNRTADLAAENLRAEKKMKAELSASPDSVLYLKKLWNFKKSGDKTLTITGYKGTQESVCVPETIGKSRVTVIGDDAFSSHAKRLTKEAHDFRHEKLACVTLPESITAIGDSAFWGCQALSSVNIPEGIVSIGNGAFCGCTALEHIDLPSSLRIISGSAFFKCTALRTIVIPEGVIKIGRHAFIECTALETLVLPASLQEIEIDTTTYYKNKSFCTGALHVLAVVPENSYALKYCEDNKIPFDIMGQ